MSTKRREPQTPPPPPEAALISAALKRSSLSQREAARRAGISEAWWRRVIAGHSQGVPANADPVTIAKMAFVVGVTPEQLAEAGGRSEVIEELRALAKAEDGGVRRRFLDVSKDLFLSTLEGLSPEEQEMLIAEWEGFVSDVRELPPEDRKRRAM